jgi:hypothetical protein
MDASPVPDEKTGLALTEHGSVSIDTRASSLVTDDRCALSRVFEAGETCSVRLSVHHSPMDASCSVSQGQARSHTPEVGAAVLTGETPQTWEIRQTLFWMQVTVPRSAAVLLDGRRVRAPCAMLLPCIPVDRSIL